MSDLLTAEALPGNSGAPEFVSSVARGRRGRDRDCVGAREGNQQRNAPVEATTFLETFCFKYVLLCTLIPALAGSDF